MAKRYVRRRKIKRRNMRNFRKAGRPVIMNSKIQKMARGPFSKFNSINPFPVNYHCKFVYACDEVLTSSSTQRLVGGIYTFRLNSPYDPYTGTLPATMNNSAHGWSLLLSSTGPYQRYKVLGVKVECTFYDPESGADGMACVMGIQEPTSTSSITGKDCGKLSSVPSCVVKHLNDTGSQRRKIIQYFPMHQLYNVSKLQFLAETGNYTGPYNNNTGTPVYMELGVANMSASVAATVKFKLNITYYTQCYDRYQDLTS